MFDTVRRIIAVITTATIITALLPPSMAVAQSTSPLNRECADLEIVYARGSGQDIGAKESVQLQRQSQLGASILGITHNFYELGSQSEQVFSYPAVSVLFNDKGQYGWNALGAKAAGGSAFKYGESVDNGIYEATFYLARRAEKCPSSQFFLAGYSQGAQVIGETYNKLLPELRQRVLFNALFGDPKLYLPEGDPALPLIMFGGRSEWRRDVPYPLTYAGSLGERKPYLPAGWSSTTGLWCNDDDFVCGSSKVFWHNDGHMTYGEDHGAIDQAVAEVMERLLVKLNMDSSEIRSELLKHFNPSNAGPTGLDVVFLIDSTSSMQNDIDAAKVFASRFSSRINAVNGRIALVEYRDRDDAFTARILSDFNEDVTDFQDKLGGITVRGGGDDPEALLHALMTAYDGLSWRKGATKAAVVLTDAGFHDPDKVDGSTLEQVIQRGLEIDPVNIYAVVPNNKQNTYSELTERSSGKAIVNEGDAATALETALTKIITRPVVRLPINQYYTTSKDETVFDASTSYSVDSEIVRWDWDFDGDGVFEIENGGPIARYTYPESGDFNVNVRATDANGGVGSHSVPVHVDTVTGLPVLPEPASAATVSSVGESETLLKWEAPVNPSGGWIIKVDGIPLGRTQPGAREITITDFKSKDDTEFGVAPVSSEEIVGMTRVAYLNKATPPPDPVPEPPKDNGSVDKTVDVLLTIAGVAVFLVQLFYALVKAGIIPASILPAEIRKIFGV